MLNTNNHPVGAHTKIILLFGCSLILIAGWWACALSYFPDYSLPLGSVANPTAGTTMYWAIWGVWGSCICILLTLSLSSFHARLQIPQQYLYLIGAAGTAAAIYIRKAIYQGMDITDDESVYRHAALLLTSGQLSESSHPLKIFFDHTFMVNDGKFYGQYFIGWPLVLAFGYLIKIADFVNALLFGGTIILIYRIAQKHTDDLMATAAALLALISPANLFSAGTMLSHTSCSFFIVLAIFLIEKLHSQSLSMRYTILLGCSCGLAFLIRPLTTVCLLTPFAIPCLLALFNKRDYHSITVWLLTSSVFVLALLMVNHAQTGFWHKTGYEAYSEYAYTNQFRFSWWNLTAQPLSIDPRNAYSFNIIQFIQVAYVAIARLFFDGLGWPGLGLAIFLLAGPRKILPYAFAILLLVLAHTRLDDLGIDTFAPNHFIEAVNLVILMWIIALYSAAQRFPHNVQPLLRMIPFALFFSIAFTLVPFRSGVISKMVRDISLPYRAIQTANISNAIVFNTLPITPQKTNEPSRHFVFWSPVNEPGLHSPIIWANHIDVQSDQQLLTYFPGRKGYVLYYQFQDRHLSTFLAPLPVQGN